MHLTYSWAITGLKHQDVGDLEKVVVQSYWTLTGTNEDGVSGSFQGATPFDPEAVDPNTFKPFSELTEAEIIGWLKGVVVGGYRDHVEQQILKQIESAAAAPVSLGPGELPWASS